MKKRPVLIHVSDHAVLRWLELEHGIDIEAVRNHLEGTVMNGAVYGAVAVQVSRVKFILRDNGLGEDGESLVVVPTTLPKGQVPHV